MTFDMSEAWRDAMAMIKANREVLMIIVGIFVFLPSLVAGFVMPDMGAVFDNPDAMQAQVLAFYSDWGWLLLLLLLLQVAGYLAMLALLRDRSRPTVGQAIGIGLKGLLPTVGILLLLFLGSMLVGVGLGMVIMLLSLALGETGGALIAVALVLGLLVFWTYAMVRLSMWGPVIAIDKARNPLAVLRRSWDMTKGKTLSLFVFYLLLAVVYLVISIVLGMIVGALALVLGTSAGVIVSALVSGLIGAVGTVIAVAVVAAVHRQLSRPWAAPAESAGEPRD